MKTVQNPIRMICMAGSIIASGAAFAAAAALLASSIVAAGITAGHTASRGSPANVVQYQQYPGRQDSFQMEVIPVDQPWWGYDTFCNDSV